MPSGTRSESTPGARTRKALDEPRAQVTIAPDAPEAAPTIETVVARALGGVETLYEEATVAWAAGLPELEWARLRARLKDRKVSSADFCKVVQDRRRASRV